MKLLDHGYVELVETWGSDQRIIESARMSTAKGFEGWGPKHASECEITRCLLERGYQASGPVTCTCSPKPGDEKLLKFLWDNAHATPFEMAGLTIEAKAPIFVFREWHRHRVPFGYNEMSARYTPLPDENYLPTVERILLANQPTTNKQAQGAVTSTLTEQDADTWLAAVKEIYGIAELVYKAALVRGIPKELARIMLPVGRYSRMRATGNLRGWLGFLKLRCAPNAQWEIRQYANAVAEIVKQEFPRTYEVARESVGMP